MKDLMLMFVAKDMHRVVYGLGFLLWPVLTVLVSVSCVAVTCDWSHVFVVLLTVLCY